MLLWSMGHLITMPIWTSERLGKWMLHLMLISTYMDRYQRYMWSIHSIHHILIQPSREVIYLYPALMLRTYVTIGRTKIHASIAWTIYRMPLHIRMIPAHCMKPTAQASYYYHMHPLYIILDACMHLWNDISMLKLTHRHDGHHVANLYQSRLACRHANYW